MKWEGYFEPDHSPSSLISPNDHRETEELLEAENNDNNFAQHLEEENQEIELELKNMSPTFETAEETRRLSDADDAKKTTEELQSNVEEGSASFPGPEAQNRFQGEGEGGRGEGSICINAPIGGFFFFFFFLNIPTPPDLLLLPTKKKTWSFLHIAALWISMAINIPLLMLGVSMISQGLNWYQALVILFVGNFLMLLCMIFNGWIGQKYGIPFPVALRAIFGVNGAKISALFRAGTLFLFLFNAI